MFVVVFVLEECECWDLFCAQTEQLASSHYFRNINESIQINKQYINKTINTEKKTHPSDIKG